MVESNCIGFAFYSLGISPRDEYVDLVTLGELTNGWFRVAEGVEDAQTLAVVDVRPPNGVVHMVVLDKNDPSSVIHRPGYRAEDSLVVKEPLSGALSFYARGIDRCWLRVVPLQIKS